MPSILITNPAPSTLFKVNSMAAIRSMLNRCVKYYCSWVQISDLEHLQDGANHKLQVKINEMASALEDDYEVCFELITSLQR